MFREPARPRHSSLVDKLLDFHWPFLLLIAALAAIGVAALYSVAGGSVEPWAQRQIVRFCLGLALLFAVALVDIRVWVRAAYPIYGVVLLMLVAVALAGVESGGARRWLGIGEYSFQPSEIMKVALVLALARYYQWLPTRLVSHPLALLVPLGMVAMPVALVVVQPDLGTAALFAVIGLAALFLAGVSWAYFIAGAGGLLALLPLLWPRLHEYQQARILTFIDPERDPQGAGYHILQSKIALGSAGLTGKGFMQGTQGQLNFLPEKHTDFIFTMFVEEMGFVGALVLLCLYLFLLLTITYIALRCASPFARLLCAGVGVSVFIYVFINVAMAMGVVPVVGVPLPLVSYGGTAMVTLMFAFGLVLNAHLHRTAQFRRGEVAALW